MRTFEVFHMPLFMKKKVQILAAINVDIHQKKEIDLSQLSLRGKAGRNKKQTSESIASSIEKMFDFESTNEISTKTKKKFRKLWHNAAAYHYFQLAHEHLYKGNMEVATKAGIQCCGYLDVLDPVTVYSLVAIATFQAKYYLACSICFSKLITLETLDEESIKSFKKLVG